MYSRGLLKCLGQNGSLIHVCQVNPEGSTGGRLPTGLPVGRTERGEELLDGTLNPPQILPWWQAAGEALCGLRVFNGWNLQGLPVEVGKLHS